MTEDDYLKEELYFALYEDLSKIFRREGSNDFEKILRQRMCDYSLKEGFAISEDLFIEADIRHFEAMINSIDELRCIPDYVPQDPNYFTAKEYIRHLKNISSGKVSADHCTSSAPGTAKTSDIRDFIIAENKGKIVAGLHKLKATLKGKELAKVSAYLQNKSLIRIIEGKQTAFVRALYKELGQDYSQSATRGSLAKYPVSVFDSQKYNSDYLIASKTYDSIFSDESDPVKN